MNKKALKSPLKILAATSVTIFSLLSVFTSTAAWFDSQRNLKNGANEMAVSVTGDLESINIYRATTADVNGYAFNPVPTQTIIAEWTGGEPVFKYKNAGDAEYSDYTSSAKITMNPNVIIDNVSMEDPFSPLSPYHPLMLVIEYREEIDASEKKVKISAETNKNFLTPAKSVTNVNLPAETIAATGNPMSSFIKTYSKGYDKDDEVDFSFTSSTLESSSSIQKSSFATLNGDQLPTFNSSPVFFTDNQNQIKKVALILEYNIEVIEYIYYYHLGESILDNTITAICDWSLMI